MTQSDAPADKPTTTEAQPTLRPRYRYRAAWRRDCEPEDEAAIQGHLDEMVAAGWELVSANAVQWLEIETTPKYRDMDTHSTSFARHCFYWRIAR